MIEYRRRSAPVFVRVTSEIKITLLAHAAKRIDLGRVARYLLGAPFRWLRHLQVCFPFLARRGLWS